MSAASGGCSRSGSAAGGVRSARRRSPPTRSRRPIATSCRYSHSLYRYTWLDDRRLVFLLGGPPRVLDAATGATESFLPERYRNVAVAGAGLWLTSDARDSVFRCGLDGSDLEVAWTERRSLHDRLKREQRRVGEIVPVEARSAWILLEVYRGRYTIVRREERWIGPLASRGAGWRPLLDCHQPEFGFLMPFD
jgi:hypothetical protein